MARLVSIMLLLSLALTSTGKTLTVRQHSTLPSVAQAIRRAAAGDTVLVYPGVYCEKTLLVDKPIFLKGIGHPVLDGEHRYEIVTINASGVTIEGFVIRHSGYSGWNDLAGIRLAAVRHVVIRDNELDDTFFGLYCQNSDSCVLENNILHSHADSSAQPGNGIHCWHCNAMQLLNNSITRHRDGIYFEFVTNSLIRGNKSFYNVRYGLHFMFSHNDRYERNTFEHNEAGVSVMFSHGVDMQDNLFADNQGGGAYGILLKEITDSRIANSRFVHNTVAIYMEGTTRVQILRNVFRDNGWAIRIQASCSADTITRNDFLGNTFDVATNGSLVLNNFDRNYWDKYQGYDLNRDGYGDIAYHPVSLYAMVAEKNPAAMLLYHSFMVDLLDRTEKVVPGITPVDLVDQFPLIKPIAL
ncbi:MAG TPA: nitrous oxide reductase family maturation protein NosD [Puia sp.]|nr:nitrous oxide reductase family maturation protein NosD [Puia sp.]